MVNGRLVAPSAYGPSTFVDLENTVGWWSSLAVLGALLAVAGVLIGADLGDLVAVSGVALFFGTAVLAGAERTELATAFGTAGIVWTAAGISLVLRTDPTLVGSLVAFTFVGGAALAIGIVGAFRALARTSGPSRTGPSN
jgi:hypothetical protein